METHDPYWGVIATGEKETDYQLAGGELELPTPRNTFHMNEIEYHQPKVSAVSCTVHGAAGALSDLTGFKFTTEQLAFFWKEALLRGADPSIGWYTASAVDLVRNLSKNIIGEEFMSFRVSFKEDDVYTALDMGYSAVCSFRGNKKYNEDKLDGILNALEFGTTTYGHCVRMVGTVERDVYEIVIDNYIETKGAKNRYKVSRENLAKLVANGVFMENAYVFAYKRDFEKMEQETVVPIWAVKSWQKALEKGIVKESDDPFRQFADGYVEKMLIELGGLTQAEGGVSLVRFIVAMDRLGNL